MTTATKIKNHRCTSYNASDGPVHGYWDMSTGTDHLWGVRVNVLRWEALKIHNALC